MNFFKKSFLKLINLFLGKSDLKKYLYSIYIE